MAHYWNEVDFTINWNRELLEGLLAALKARNALEDDDVLSDYDDDDDALCDCEDGELDDDSEEGVSLSWFHVKYEFEADGGLRIYNEGDDYSDLEELTEEIHKFMKERDIDGAIAFSEMKMSTRRSDCREYVAVVSKHDKNFYSAWDAIPRN